MTPGRLPAILLVVAFLACHGLFGAARQASASAHGPNGGQASAHVMHMVSPDESHDGHQTSHHGTGHLAGGAEYMAVLITALLGMVIWLLRGFRPWDAAIVATSAIQNLRIVSAWLHPPRGPTLPALQVLRL